MCHSALWIPQGSSELEYGKDVSRFCIQVLGLFRVDEAHEIEGLDVVKHNEPAYPIGINAE